MSVSSTGASNPFSYLQWLLQSGSADSTGSADSGAPSDPLQALFQDFSGGSSSNPLLSALGSGDGSSSAGGPTLSADVMQALFSVQTGSSGANPSPIQSLVSQFDTNGDGQISESEFENAIGPNADQSMVDQLFSKIDTNGDGQISTDEIQSAMQKAHGGGGHHHHHHMAAGSGGQQGSGPLQSLMSGTSADGTTSQSSTNSDGSTTTTITYADGTKIEMTSPAAQSDAGASQNSNPAAMAFSNMLKQLIQMQAQLVAPTTNLSV